MTAPGNYHLEELDHWNQKLDKHFREWLELRNRSEHKGHFSLLDLGAGVGRMNTIF